MINRFRQVLQGAIRLGTIYLNLCETGEVGHLNWITELSCRNKDVSGDLHNQYDELEGYFKAWTSVLDSQRKRCKELNYFTAKQLLYMRKELAELRRGREFVSLGVQVTFKLLCCCCGGCFCQSDFIAVNICSTYCSCTR
jgi:hypothetical protein